MSLPEPPSSAAVFCTTRWGMVAEARGSTSPQSRAALEELCRGYWFPLYAYLRRHGQSPPDAQDLVQEFCVHLLENRVFQTVRPDKGRFRTFLLACLNHFVADQAKRANALKRGGGKTHLSFEGEEAEGRYVLALNDSLSADQLFDRRWATAVLERAMEQLRAEQKAAGKEQQFILLQPFLTDTVGPGEYDEVAAELGVTPNAVAVAISRLRNSYRELARREVAGTLASLTDIDAEMRHLLAALRG